MSATPEGIARWLAERDAVSARVQRRLEERRAAGRPGPHPVPEVACRVALVSEVGSAALALQRAVQRAGGRVQVTYARGHGVHGVTGRPTAVRDSIAVRCWGPEGERLIACWTRSGAGKWICDLRLSWGREGVLRKIDDAHMKSEVASWGSIR